MSPLERIVAACGGILLDGGARALIPGPNHSYKDRSVSLALTEEGRIIIHCFSPKDDWRTVRAALQQKGLLDGARREASSQKRPSVVQPLSEDKLPRVRKIWDEGRSTKCTAASVYLRRRAIANGASLDALRFHPRMTSVDDRLRRPALLAAITDSTGMLQGVQVTLLSSYGAGKALVATPRRVVGRLLGGAVHLAPAGDALVIAEGVESALSASDALQAPAWAALTAHNLSLFEPPPCVKHLIVAADNDPAGRSAFQALRARLMPSLVVDLALPPERASDWNAWAMSKPSCSDARPDWADVLVT